MTAAAPPPPGATDDPDRTEALRSGTTALSVQRFRLRVEAGPDLDRVVVSRGTTVTIGTDDTAGLVLTDGAVSRFHCELRVDGGTVTVHDLGSRNGTTVDGVAVLAAVLHPGAVLGVGRTRIRCEPDGERVVVPLSAASAFGRMAGSTPVMRAVFALLERAAPTEATILLHGETGTGKEAAAESIHAASPRKDGPLIVIDCGALPPNLLEAELFGHEKGAFTGAVAARAGAFEAARGGTIFLDEIGELSIELQPKLLRVLERREVKRVGADHYHPVDVRVLAATHRDLRAEVNAKRFRADLYYRLAVVEVTLPPLRERLGDLPLIVDRLLEGLPAAARAELAAPAFVDHLARHRWPGNVRELRNYLERCAALGVELAPRPAAVDEPAGPAGPAIDASTPLRDARERWTTYFERAYLDDLLRRHGDNLTVAARTAGIDRAHLYRLLWKHGLR